MVFLLLLSLMIDFTVQKLKIERSQADERGVRLRLDGETR